MNRSTATWLLYTTFACMAFLLNGLGAVLPSLQRELRVARGDVAFYPSLFAVGLVIVGLSGGSLVTRLGRPVALNLSIGAMVAGGLLFAFPSRLPTLFGMVLVGLGAALLIQLVPATLAALHPASPTAAVGEVNGVASAASVIAPLAVAFSISLGAGWRAGYLGPSLPVLVAILIPLSRAKLPPVPAPTANSTNANTGLIGRWLDLVLAVSVEFCMVFWAASAIAEWHGAKPGEAPAVAALFLVGMAICRAQASPITRWVGDGRVLILTSAVIAILGFAVFWFASGLAVAGGGLVVTGVGVALLYPATVTRLIAARPLAPDRAAAWAALGSGVAIGGAPFILGRLSDASGFRGAFLIVPVLLVLLMLRCLSISASPSERDNR